MYRFFIDRPIVSMVISIVMVIVGGVSILTLPIAQFPNIAASEDPGERHLRGRGRPHRGTIRGHSD